MIIFLALSGLSEAERKRRASAVYILSLLCCGSAVYCSWIRAPQTPPRRTAIHSPPPPSLCFPRPSRGEQRGQTASGRPLISTAPQRPDQKLTSLGSPPPPLQPKPRSDRNPSAQSSFPTSARVFSEDISEQLPRRVDGGKGLRCAFSTLFPILIA